MKLSWTRTLLRSILALGFGILLGFWGRSCARRGDAHEFVNVTIADPSYQKAKFEVPKKDRSMAEAKQWFREMEQKMRHSKLSKPLTSEELRQVEALTSEELAVWLQEGLRLGVSNVLLDMLMERWGEIDRLAFVAWIEKLYEQPITKRFFSGSIDLNPPGMTAALKVLRRLDPNGVKAVEKGRIFGGLITISTEPEALTRLPRPPKPDFEKVSAEEAVRWLAVNQQGDFQELTEFASRLAKKDVNAALAWAQAIPKHIKQRRETLRSIVLEGIENTEWLLQHVHLLASEKDMAYALNNASKLYGSAAGRKSVMEWAMSREVKAERAAGLAMLRQQMHSIDQKEAVGLLSLISDGSERGTFLEAMLDRYRTYGEGEWEKLLTYIEKEPGNANGSMGAGVAAQQLAKQKSIKEALAWADSLPPDDRRAAAYGGVWDAWFQQDAGAASVAALELPIGPERLAAAAAIARTIGNRTPIEVLNFTRQLSATERVKIFPALADGLKQHNAADAREEIVQLAPAASDEASFAKSAVALLPDIDTATGQKQAMRWLDQLPAGKLRRELIESLRRNSSAKPAEFTEWLARQPAAD